MKTIICVVKKDYSINELKIALQNLGATINHVGKNFVTAEVKEDFDCSVLNNIANVEMNDVKTIGVGQEQLENKHPSDMYSHNGRIKNCWDRKTWK